MAGDVQIWALVVPVLGEGLGRQTDETTAECRSGQRDEGGGWARDQCPALIA